LAAVASRQDASVRQLSEELGTSVAAVSVAALPEHANLIFVAVPDAQVETCCDLTQLTAAHAIVHLSGTLALSALERAACRGAKRGVMHPLQAFPRAADPDRFVGIHMGVEADDQTLEHTLSAIADALGASAFSLRGVDRAAYHAAAVFASNYVVALHVAAARMWTLAGLPQASARSALAPLTLGAAGAIAQRELQDALTGPLSRGDLSTLIAHLRALAADSELSALYSALARQLLSLPIPLGPTEREQLEQLFSAQTASAEAT